MQSTKKRAANAAASAKAGREKTKAIVQEKVGKMLTTGDPMVKEMATQKKEERIHEAERQKREAREQNAAARQAAMGGGTFGHHYTTGGDYSTTGSTGKPASGAYGAGWERIEMGPTWLERMIRTLLVVLGLNMDRAIPFKYCTVRNRLLCIVYRLYGM